MSNPLIREIIKKKRYTRHKDDTYLWIVLAETVKNEYAVWLYNSDGDFYVDGYYSEYFTDALSNYNDRGVREEKKEDTAFRSSAMPVNSLPFLRRIREILDENGTNNPSGLVNEELMKFRANLWILLCQTHGQLINIDTMEEFDELDNYFK